MDQNSIIEVSNLKKNYGKFTALHGINLTVKKGEVFGFIGPNGAGKTTTLRVLLGILQATAGSVKVFGLDSWKDAVEIHKRIAYVPGDVNLWPNLTGGEVIDLFINLRGQKIDRERRDRFIKLFDFDPTKKCNTYSKGNRQKVALVSALASDAELFILDEPSSGLDPLMERVFQDCIAELKAQGKTILLSSHILSEVERLCDKVAIIREGLIVETGTLTQLRHLTRVKIYTETKKAIAGLEKIKGVSDIEKRGEGISFLADSDEIGNIVKKLTEYEITKLESMPPSLEELFMRHYDKTAK
jgi:ABC-2 type transport system ATP-binding protein